MVFFFIDSWRDFLKIDIIGQFIILIFVLQFVCFDVFVKGFFFDMKILVFDVFVVDVEVILLLFFVDVGVKFLVKWLYFVGDQAVLFWKLLLELDCLLWFMELNFDFEIIIYGYVNVFNLFLISLFFVSFKFFEDWVKCIYEFLIDYGIDVVCFLWKVYGNWEMCYLRARFEGQ